MSLTEQWAWKERSVRETGKRKWSGNGEKEEEERWESREGIEGEVGGGGRRDGKGEEEEEERERAEDLEVLREEGATGVRKGSQGKPHWESIAFTALQR